MKTSEGRKAFKFCLHEGRKGRRASSQEVMLNLGFEEEQKVENVRGYSGWCGSTWLAWGGAVAGEEGL